jgi:chromosome partitioning protein
MTKTGKIIAVANQKGGVGKTTTAINVSVALSRLRKKILVVDADPQGNASSGLGVKTRKLTYHLYHALTGQCQIEQTVLSAQADKISLVPSSIDLAAAELELISLADRESQLQKLLLPLKERFDYIVIDCPPSLGLLTINALTASSSVLIPMQCEYFALEGLAQLVNTIRSVKKSLNPQLYIEGIVLTMFDKRNRLTYQVAEEIKAHFEEQLFATVIPRNVRLSESPSHGKSVFQYDGSSSGAISYQALAREFLKRQV